jgi:phosphate starvation-inducible PhoH-like protein
LASDDQRAPAGAGARTVPRSGAPRSAPSRARLGPASVNLKILSDSLGVKIGQRGDELFFPDEDPALRDLAAKAVAALEILPTASDAPLPWEVECLASMLKGEPDLAVEDLFAGYRPRLSPDKLVVARTPGQKLYLEAIKRSDLVVGIGPAGTGKTYLAVAMAVEALLSEKVSRLVLTRPAVEAGERLGFLPGDLAEKIDPYLRPLYDALSDLIPYDKLQKFHERRLIEVAPLAFMRGRTLSGAFVILDEAQNTTSEQMRMFLTRLGPGSKAVVTGDPDQSDLPGGRPKGLLEAMAILPGIEGVAICRFQERDVVRHKLVKSIIAAYAKLDKDAGRSQKAVSENGSVSLLTGGAQGASDSGPKGGAKNGPVNGGKSGLKNGTRNGLKSGPTPPEESP